LAISPVRLGSDAAYHLGWRHGSVLNSIGDNDTVEKLEIASQITDALRNARMDLAQLPTPFFASAIKHIVVVAKDMGISIENPTASVESKTFTPQSNSFALHNGNGVPLSNYGLGSVRLLSTGLQKSVETNTPELAKIVLIDEIEHGLEPHRLVRLLDSLGVKKPTGQSFFCNHSPVSIRELSVDQLFLVRSTSGEVCVQPIEKGLQGAVRIAAEAFLAKKIIVCEGPTEIGFIRGLDRFRGNQGHRRLTALGVALVDAGGVSKIYPKVRSFMRAGFSVAVLRDSDKHPDSADDMKLEDDVLQANKACFKWEGSLAIEDAIFAWLPVTQIIDAINVVCEEDSASKVDHEIKSATSNAIDLHKLRNNQIAFDQCVRMQLSNCAKKNSWFKRINLMEDACFNFIAPHISNAPDDFCRQVDSMTAWIEADV